MAISIDDSLTNKVSNSWINPWISTLFGELNTSLITQPSIFFIPYSGVVGISLLLSIRPPPVVLAPSHNGVLHWVLLTHASGNDLQQLLSIEPKKEGRRVPLHTALIDDSMDGGDEEVVRLPHEAIRNVDHE